MSLAIWAIRFRIAKIANDCIGNIVIAKRVAPCARPGGAGARGRKSLGHGLGSAWVMTLAIAKYA
jgi:hypothetical protein